MILKRAESIVSNWTVESNGKLILCYEQLGFPTYTEDLRQFSDQDDEVNKIYCS